MALTIGCDAVQIAALCELGPDYQSTFMRTESDPAFDQAAAAAGVVVEGKEALGPLLLMSYNAQASQPCSANATRVMAADVCGGVAFSNAMPCRRRRAACCTAQAT